MDAMQRGCRCQWYWIIMMPFGPLIYFFAVKIHDPEFRRIRIKLTEKKVTLKELRYQADRSPSIQNKLTLAQALHDSGEFGEAAEYFKQVLSAKADEKAALYGLGLCLLELKEGADAVSALEKVVGMDLSYQDYAPSSALVDAYWEQGKKNEALELQEKIVKKSQRLKHKLALAGLFDKIEDKVRAKKLLEEAIEDHDNSPKYVKRTEKSDARQARNVLKALSI